MLSYNGNQQGKNFISNITYEGLGRTQVVHSNGHELIVNKAISETTRPLIRTLTKRATFALAETG